MELYGSPVQSAIPELSIILIGSRGAGKSSVVNTLLGRDERFFRSTTQCIKEQGKIEGRKMTLVDTPGWWLNSHITDTPEIRKYEIVRTVSLIPPGAYMFLLVIPVDVIITETNKRAIEEHLGLFGEGVWNHTLVLFTFGDKLGTKNMNGHLEREGKSLHYLIAECKNRYHVFNNNERGNLTQVKELLEKLEEMAAEKSDPYYDIGIQRSQELNERRKQIDEKAKKGKREVEIHREKLRLLRGDTYSPTLRVVLLGFKGAGMSSTGNTILGKDAFATARTTHCVSREGTVVGKLMTVVDTPGWWRGSAVAHSAAQDMPEILLSTTLCPPGPHTFLLVIRTDIAFTELDRRSVMEHMELLGERVWRHTMVLFSNGDSLGDTMIEQYIESEGEALQWLIEKCGNRYHVFKQGTSQQAKINTQITELLVKIEETVAENNGSYFEADQRIMQEIEAKINMDLMSSGDMKVCTGSTTFSRSMEFPLQLCGGDASDVLSSGSWVCGSQQSIASDASLQSRVSNMSSGYESMWSLDKPVTCLNKNGIKFTKKSKFKVVQKKMNAKVKKQPFYRL